MNVETVSEHDVLTFAHMWLDFIRPKHGLFLIRDEDHDNVCPLRNLAWAHDREAFGFSFWLRRRRGLQSNPDFYAIVFQVERVGMALAAIADNTDLFALDKGEVCILLIINIHLYITP